MILQKKKNIKSSNKNISVQLKAEVKKYDSIKSSSVVPPFGQGRKTFKAPKNWEIKE